MWITGSYAVLATERLTGVAPQVNERCEGGKSMQAMETFETQKS